jgi:hypothetical protein
MSSKFFLGISATLLTGTAAWAGSQIDSRVSPCTGTNCAGETIRVTHQAKEPFVSQLFARAGECLRLDVTEQSGDTALFVVAPVAGQGASSSDREAGVDLRPLLLLDNLPWTGWYTVVIGFQGEGNTVVRARLDFGRYPGGNANCQPPATAVAQSFQAYGGQDKLTE